eukprot:m.484429 g.484429  ORF g.484429 m.484429 type:complete len:146 (+) comp23350_c0_seq1:3045-3482(+)
MPPIWVFPVSFFGVALVFFALFSVGIYCLKSSNKNAGINRNGRRGRVSDAEGPPPPTYNQAAAMTTGTTNESAMDWLHRNEHQHTPMAAAATASINMCDTCAKIIPSGSAFCPGCGAASSQCTCPSCQAPMVASDKFCAKCGSRR